MEQTCLYCTRIKITFGDTLIKLYVMDWGGYCIVGQQNGIVRHCENFDLLMTFSLICFKPSVFYLLQQNFPMGSGPDGGPMPSLGQQDMPPVMNGKEILSAL